MTDGILLIDKPKDFTSFDVIAKLRGMTRIRRIGHAGTLDPMATGLLPCLFGTAARLCDCMPDETKTYEADVLFGISTDTQDITGEVLSKSDLPLEKEALLAALRPFHGTIMQTPPMYSAVRINGQRLYDLAREGRDIERPAREITIYSLDLLDINEEKRTARFSVSCSRGTFVRTIFHDVGQALHCGAALTALRRTAASGWKVEDAITMQQAQELTNSGTLLEHLLPVSSAFDSLPRMDVGQWQAKMLKNGVALSLGKLSNPAPGRYSVWCGEDFLGLGTVEENAPGMRLKIF